MASPTGNESWRDAVVAHTIAQLRLYGSIANRVVALLDAVEAELQDQIRRRASDITSATGTDITSPRVSKRLRLLEEAISDIRAGAMKDGLDLAIKELRDMAVAEPAFMSAALGDNFPVVLDTILPDRKQLESLVQDFPVQGNTMRKWFKKIEADDLTRIMNEVRTGLVQGQGVDDLARRVVGSARLNGTDGITQITRNNAEAIVRTAGQTFAARARDMFFAENSDVFEEEVWVATLDSRTTAICRALDGKRFPVGQGQRPPAHWGCRSVRVAVVTDDGTLIGKRPLNESTEQQLLREFSNKHGLDAPKTRGKLPRGTKGAFDEFARKRARELIGSAPAETTYEAFLRRLPADRQDDILGRTKGRLFRDGKLEVSAFANPKTGKEYTLRQLVIRESAAFKRAGLDPKDYI